MPPISSLLTLVWICLFFGLAIMLWFVWGAFEDRPSRGALSLVVPGYAFWYGWTHFSHARHRALTILALAFLVAAGLGALLASAMRASGPLIAS